MRVFFPLILSKDSSGTSTYIYSFVDEFKIHSTKVCLESAIKAQKYFRKYVQSEQYKYHLLIIFDSLYLFRTLLKIFAWSKTLFKAVLCYILAKYFYLKKCWFQIFLTSLDNASKKCWWLLKLTVLFQKICLLKAL